MAPDTMVAAVAANTVWKMRKVKFQSCSGPVGAREAEAVVPNTPL
jgi:hypothetical protein